VDAQAREPRDGAPHSSRRQKPRLDHYDLRLSSTLDPRFGPVLVLEPSDKRRDLRRDREIELPPLNTAVAHRLLERIGLSAALEAIRGGPIDLSGLEQFLVRFSQLVVEHSWIQGIEIDPLRLSSEGVTAVEVRVRLHSAARGEEALPRPALVPPTPAP
jgi:acetyltransferase